MTDDAEPGRPPAHDLAAFDLTKRSPEQLAQSFALWKARRRPPQAAPGAGTPIAAKPPPAATERAEKSAAPGSRAVGAKRGWAKRSIPVQYSDTFASLLAAGSEPAVQRSEPAPIVVARPSPQRTVSPGRRLRAMTILAGAASLAALAGGALIEFSSWRDAEPKSAQAQPAMSPTAAPIARAATNAATIAWTLQPVVDRALLKAGAQPTPAMQSASKAAIPGAKSAPSQPTFKKAAPGTAEFVAKPFIPNAAPAPQPAPSAAARASIQTAPLATAIRTGDPRPDALFQQNRGQGDGALGGRVAAGGKPAATSKSKSAAQAPAAARNGTAASAGSGDPRGEGSGGAQGAAAGGTGTDAGAGGGGSTPGNGNNGGADTGGSDSGGADAGGGEGADGGDGEAGSSDAEPADDAPGNTDTNQGN